MSNFKIIVSNNLKNFGDKINNHLKKLRPESEDYIIYPDNIRFNTGEGKCIIKENLQNKNVYILSDVSNSDKTYQLKGEIHKTSPDDHFMDIVRIISAINNQASKKTLITPYLYSSRQYGKGTGESSDGDIALKILKYLGINNIITCDVHDENISSNIEGLTLTNIQLTKTLLTHLLNKENIISYKDIVCISPDEGAIERTKLYNNLLPGSEFAYFYKRRSKEITDGTAKIENHMFIGNKENLKNKIAIIVDDMIDTGSSILDTAKQLKEFGVKKVYLITTFAFFTKGIEKFREYYQDGHIEKVYSTNLINISQEVINESWFEIVDCSKDIANIINNLEE